MKSQEVRRGQLFGSIVLILFIFLGCNAAATTDVARPTSTAIPTETPRPTRTSQPTRTPFPTRTPEPTPIPTPIPTATVAPPIRIFDEVMHPDWSLDASDLVIDTQHIENAFTGFYALELAPTQPHQVFFLSLRSSAAKAYPAGSVQMITFQLYSGDTGISLADLEVGIIGSNGTPFWSPAENGFVDISAESAPISDNSFLSPFDTLFPPRTLELLGIVPPIPPQTWVKVTYPVSAYHPNNSYQWLTGFYIENTNGFVQPIIIDDLQFFTAN